MEEPTSLGSKLSRKLSVHPSQVYPGLGVGLVQQGREGRLVG